MDYGYESLPPWPQEVSLNQLPSSLGRGWTEENAGMGGLGSFLGPLGGEGSEKLRKSCPGFTTGVPSVKPFFPGPEKLIGIWHRNLGM